VFFGCGSVCASVPTAAQVGVFQVAVVWGLGIATAIHLTGALSGAHLNPAATLSMAGWSDFPKARVVGYVVAQLVGAFAAATVRYLTYFIKGMNIAAWKRLTVSPSVLPLSPRLLDARQR
jgi:glycerol uptake facilitator protein